METQKLEKLNPHWRIKLWFLLRALELSFAFTFIIIFQDKIAIGMISAWTLIVFYYANPLYGIFTVLIRLPFRGTKFYDLRLFKAAINTAVYGVYGAYLFWQHMDGLPFTGSFEDTLLPLEKVNHLVFLWLGGMIFNFCSAYWLYGNAARVLEVSSYFNAKDAIHHSDPGFIQPGKWFLLRLLEFAAFVVWMVIFSVSLESGVLGGVAFYAVYFLNPIYALAVLLSAILFSHIEFWSVRFKMALKNAVTHGVYGYFLLYAFQVFEHGSWIGFPRSNSSILTWAWIFGICFNFATAWYVYRPEMVKKPNVT
ncbi:hypothetical protein [Paremcibacter congregatus]|uniref:hypothetical protein n=1 Tax=Paremcibacter congregatus TaxID=2043170 RepID=UPI0030EB8C4E